MTERPQHYRFHQGDRVLPFSAEEYEDRIAGLRDVMELHGLDAVVLTSMQNIAYYSGFLYCSFGRPYGLVVTKDQSITISAGIDAGVEGCISERLQGAPDHPMTIHFPEGEYLKGLVIVKQIA